MSSALDRPFDDSNNTPQSEVGMEVEKAEPTGSSALQRLACEQSRCEESFEACCPVRDSRQSVSPGMMSTAGPGLSVRNGLDER